MLQRTAAATPFSVTCTGQFTRKRSFLRLLLLILLEKSLLQMERKRTAARAHEGIGAAVLWVRSQRNPACSDQRLPRDRKRLQALSAGENPRLIANIRSTHSVWNVSSICYAVAHRMTARENRLWLILLATALLPGCASVRAPLPPSLDIPQPVPDLRAARKADQVTLAWTLPVHTTDNMNVRHIGVTHICRRQDSPLVDCKDPVQELTVAQLNPVTIQPARDEKHPAERQVSAHDTIGTEGQNDPTGYFSYAVETLNQRGRSAGLSNQVRVPIAPTLAPPSDLKAEVSAHGVTLTWSAIPPPNTPELKHLYRIYRRDVASKTDAVAGEVPVESTAEPTLVDGGL